MRFLSRVSLFPLLVVIGAAMLVAPVLIDTWNRTIRVDARGWGFSDHPANLIPCQRCGGEQLLLNDGTYDGYSYRCFDCFPYTPATLSQ